MTGVHKERGQRGRDGLTLPEKRQPDLQKEKKKKNIFRHREKKSKVARAGSRKGKRKVGPARRKREDGFGRGETKGARTIGLPGGPGS